VSAISASEPAITSTSDATFSDADRAVASALAEQYDVLALLGRGGMGTVYKALDKRLEQLVAIKIIHSNADEVALKRLRTEAHALAEMNHPNIVRVFRLEQINSLCVLAMEYVDATDLDRLIQKRGKLTPAEARNILTQAAGALEQAHKQGIVHRDLKPSNILVTESGGTLQIKIVDFGIAKFVDGDEQRLTRTGAVVGSPEYISPEVGRGQPADARSDIYSLGCVMYTCLTGHAPFTGESAYEVMLKHMTDRVPEVRCSEDPSLSALISKCTEPAPDARFQTADELMNAVNLGTNFRHNTTHSAAKSKVKIKKTPVVIGIVALIIVLGVAIKSHVQQKAVEPFDVETSRIRLFGEIIEYIQAGKPYDAELAQLNKLPASTRPERATLGEIYEKVGFALREIALNNNDVVIAKKSFAEYELSAKTWPDDQYLCDEPGDMAILTIHFKSKDFYEHTLAELNRQFARTKWNEETRLHCRLQMLALASLMNDKPLKNKILGDIRKSPLSSDQVKEYITHLQSRYGGAKDDLIAAATDRWPNFPYHEESKP
jgi:serine/threonine protein kinase